MPIIPSVKFIKLDATQYDATSRTLNVNIAQELAIESNKYTVDCKQLNQIHIDQSLEVKLDSVVKAYGWIVNQNDSLLANKERRSRIESGDYSWFFNYRVVNESYTSKTVEYILTDILTKHVPEVAPTYIKASGIVISNIRFNFKPVMAAIQDLLSLVSEWYFYVDQQNKAHFFQRYESDGSELNTTNIKADTINATYDRTTAVNRVWIVGAKQADTNYIDQFFTGDGQQRYFTLSYEPNYTDMYVGGVLKNSKLVENDDGAQDFLIDKRNRVVFIPNNIATPFSGTIKAHYRPTVQLIDYFENAQEANKKLIEKAIKNQNITDRMEARRFGKAEIKKTAIMRRKISCITTADLSIGQRVYFNINHAILGDLRAYYLVKSLSYDINPTTIATGRIEKQIHLEELI